MTEFEMAEIYEALEGDPGIPTDVLDLVGGYLLDDEVTWKVGWVDGDKPRHSEPRQVVTTDRRWALANLASYLDLEKILNLVPGWRDHPEPPELSAAGREALLERCTRRPFAPEYLYRALSMDDLELLWDWEQADSDLICYYTLREDEGWSDSDSEG